MLKRRQYQVKGLFLNSKAVALQNRERYFIIVVKVIVAIAGVVLPLFSADIFFLQLFNLGGKWFSAW